VCLCHRERERKSEIEKGNISFAQECVDGCQKDRLRWMRVGVESDWVILGSKIQCFCACVSVCVREEVNE